MLWSCAPVIIMLCLSDGVSGARRARVHKHRTSSNVSAGTIVNDEIWYANDGTGYVKASYGGHISQIDGVFYWIGNDPNMAGNGADIHIYESRTLGSNDWKHVTKAVEMPSGDGSGGMNCYLLRSPATGKYVIVAKSGLRFYQSSSVKGPWNWVRTLTNGQVGNRGSQWKVGGMSAFQDGTDAYVITSRRDTRSDASPPPRHIGIYKLTPDFLDVDHEVLWLPTVQREAMWAFKKGSTWYMTMSHTAGWRPSDCYYRTAARLSGPWSEEHEIGMDPEPQGRFERSHGSQCRWIMNVGGNQWMFGGDRYPYKPDTSTSEYDMSKGNYVFLPVHFSGNRPIVTWQRRWQVQTSTSPSPAPGVMCTCTPGTNHQFTCTDGSTGWCGRSNECYAQNPFPIEEKWPRGCREK